MGALEIAGRASGSRARVSESRVRTLLEAVERLALDADPDVLTRVARLTEEIAERRAEIARLDRTGVVDTVDDDTMLEQAENILHLTRELPADFARVVESIRAMQRDVVTDLRQDVRPAGEVLLPSPLLTAELPDWMRLHFQVDAANGLAFQINLPVCPTGGDAVCAGGPPLVSFDFWVDDRYFVKK